MNNYNNNRGGNRRGAQRSDRRGSGRSNFGSKDSHQNEMYDAVCAECDNNCRIPFFPKSGKPVYCSNCFEKRGNDNNFNDRRSNNNYNDRRSNASNINYFKPSNDRPQVNYKEEFKAVNAKLDQIINLISIKEDKKVTKKTKTSKVSEETPVTPKRKKPKVKTVAEIIDQAVKTE